MSVGNMDNEQPLNENFVLRNLPITSNGTNVNFVVNLAEARISISLSGPDYPTPTEYYTAVTTLLHDSATYYPFVAFGTFESDEFENEKMSAELIRDLKNDNDDPITVLDDYCSLADSFVADDESSGYIDVYFETDQPRWNGYPNHMYCKFDIRAECNIEWKFQSFDIEDENSCHFDYVNVDQGWLGQTGRMCQQEVSLFNATNILAENPYTLGYMDWTSTFDSVMSVEFYSDDVVRHHGFKLQWQCEHHLQRPCDFQEWNMSYTLGPGAREWESEVDFVFYKNGEIVRIFHWSNKPEANVEMILKSGNSFIGAFPEFDRIMVVPVFWVSDVPFTKLTISSNIRDIDLGPITIKPRTDENRNKFYIDIPVDFLSK